MAKTASTVWANVVLKRRNAVLARVKDSISFESFMDLRNSKLSSLAELFPAEAVEQAVERSSRVLHDEAIRKAVSANKPARKSAKKFIFLSLPDSNSRLSAPQYRLQASPLSVLQPLVLRLLPPLPVREEVLKILRLPHSHGTGVFDSPSAPRSGLSGCSVWVIWSRFITSHLCCWYLRHFHPVPRGQFER